ncbi:MAG: glycoside hydrolase [Saprospiraceae bacterium]|nr:glycoside hydrolase [Saprospiraceae bacterium]
MQFQKEVVHHQSLEYLCRISGQMTVAGQHNREPNSNPDQWTKYIKRITGKYPALWSGDFLFQQENIDDRPTMIKAAHLQWKNGALINLMLHTCPPNTGEPCLWDPGIINHPLSDEEWKELTTDGLALNLAWKERLDTIAVYLRYLADHHVEVLFRPLHEMNQAAFWWGGRPGPNGSAKLYRITHHYLEDYHNLNNLIWVWDMQDLSRDLEAYNPGEDYWDVFAFDVYADGYDQSWYDYILTFVGDKPIAIGECGALPSAEMLARQPRWTFFMPWAEWVKDHNSEDQIRQLYNDPRIITRDEMSGWE